MATPTENNDVLLQTIRGLGYLSLVDFAREQAKGILEQKIAYYQSRIDFFEQKYGLDFVHFGEQFEQLKPYSVLEKEDDSLRWETALDVVNSYRNELLALNQ